MREKEFVKSYTQLYSTGDDTVNVEYISFNKNVIFIRHMTDTNDNASDIGTNKVTRIILNKTIKEDDKFMINATRLLKDTGQVHLSIHMVDMIDEDPLLLIVIGKYDVTSIVKPRLWIRPYLAKLHYGDYARIYPYEDDIKTIVNLRDGAKPFDEYVKDILSLTDEFDFTKFYTYKYPSKSAWRGFSDDDSGGKMKSGPKVRTLPKAFTNKGSIFYERV